jgi:glycosyltransferase involved in cell wall biosynthesis
MLISWIVPYYDLEPWLLRRCLQSLVEEGCDRTSYEVIVVDDGSTREDAQEVVDEFPEAPIRLIRRPNGGQSAARNTGLEAARGEYLGFVDADDAVDADWLPTLMALLRTERPDLIVYEARKFRTRELPTGPTEELQPTSIPVETYTTAAELMATHNLAGAAWLNLIRRDLQQQYGWKFPEGISFHEDSTFTTQVYYYAGKTLYLDAPVYLYYQRQGSIMHVSTPKHVERRLNDFLRYLRGVHELATAHAADATPIQRRALERKQRLLAGDYLRAMLRLYLPVPQIQKRLQALVPMGLYPLQPADRGLKYRGLAALGNHAWGIRLLYAAEAIMKHHSKL